MATLKEQINFVHKECMEEEEISVDQLPEDLKKKYDKIETLTAKLDDEPENDDLKNTIQRKCVHLSDEIQTWIEEEEEKENKKIFDDTVAEGDALLAKNEFDNAIAKYNEAVGLDEEQEDFIAGKIAGVETAREALEKSKSSEDAAKVIADADKALEGEDFEGAIKLYEEALKLTPEDESITKKIDDAKAAMEKKADDEAAAEAKKKEEEEQKKKEEEEAEKKKKEEEEQVDGVFGTPAMEKAVLAKVSKIDGEERITIKDLKEIIGKKPEYPTQIVNRVYLQKVMFREEYRITAKP